MIGSVAYAETSSNLIGGSWNNVATGTHPNDCCTGGPAPLYDPATNTIHFSYGLTAVHQVIGINTALQGSGIQINGWNWGYDLRNMNGSGGQSGTDTISVTSFITNNLGYIVQQSDQYYSTQFDWTRFSGTEILNTPITLANNVNLGIQFVSRDAGFWAGYYGPQVRNVNLTANYSVDPCAANPLYSVDCAGYNNVLNSGNLIPSFGTAYAINQALAYGNSGVRVHGYEYGFDYEIGPDWCSGFNFYTNSCTYSQSSVTGTSTISNSNGQIVESDSQTFSGQTSLSTFDRQIVFSASRAIETLGSYSLSTSATGIAWIGNERMSINFTPDICQSDPLVNPSCPGYAEAYFNLQCSINTLYNPSCPGYAVAYFNFQCSANPLYATQCPGYEQAYFTQQCTLDALYNTSCPGYAEAYFDQQCTLDGLYDKTCPNYGEAYALKYVLNTNSSSTTSTSSTSKTEVTPSVSSDGTIKTEVSKTGDSTVDSVISSNTTSTTSPTATVQLAPSPSSSTTTTVEAKTETKSETKTESKTETASEGSTNDTETSASTTETSTTTAQTDNKTESKDKPKTARQELAEKRKEAAKQAAIKAGKEAAENMGNVTSIESQIAVQNVVLAAMSYVPGFNAYNIIIPDGVGYKPFEIYKQQRTVDNARLVRGLTGASDVLHEQMVASQYPGN